MDRSNRSQESNALRAKGETCTFNFGRSSGFSSGFRSLFVGSLLWALAIGTSGCAVSQSLDSFSDSSGSVSDSLGSFSDSSESSSGSSGDETAYRNDIRDYTVAYLRTHLGTEGSPEALRLGISEVALTRGITNWEALPSTFVAVGAGFAEAGLTLAEAEPYRNALAAPNSASAQSMIAGNNSVRMPAVAGDARSPADDL